MNRRALGAAMSGAALLVMAASGAASAHVAKQFGTYTVELGWLNEPTFTGERNAVVAIVHDAADKPVADLAAGDLTVTVTAGGQTSAPLPLIPAYDPVEATGTPGTYTADMIPTQPGDYTFHLAGTIHGTPVDETATSSDTTFNAVEDPGSIQFPAKVPTTGDVATKVDKLDSLVQTTADAAASASSQASQSLLIGVVVGGVGILVGFAGVVLALRAKRAY